MSMPVCACEEEKNSDCHRQSARVRSDLREIVGDFGLRELAEAGGRGDADLEIGGRHLALEALLEGEDRRVHSIVEPNVVAEST